MRILPNILTAARIALIPLIVFFFFSSQIENNFLIAMILFILAMGTDIIDGYIARKFSLITKLGIFLDPLADKLLINIALFSLTYTKTIPFWLAAALFARDLISSDFKSFATYSKVYVTIAPIEGKIKALLESIGIPLGMTALHYQNIFLQKTSFMALSLALAVGILGLARLLLQNYHNIFTQHYTP